jgi:Na+/phosphate symporter
MMDWLKEMRYKLQYRNIRDMDKIIVLQNACLDRIMVILKEQKQEIIELREMILQLIEQKIEEKK